MTFEDRQLFNVLNAVIKADMELDLQGLLQMTGQFIGHGAEMALIKKYVRDGWLYKKKGENPRYGITKPGRGKYADLMKRKGLDPVNKWRNRSLWVIAAAGLIISTLTFIRGCNRSKDQERSKTVGERQDTLPSKM